MTPYTLAYTRFWNTLTFAALCHYRAIWIRGWGG